MLDLEMVVPPVQSGTDIVSLEKVKTSLGIRHSEYDDRIIDAIDAAAGKAHGREGELNRTVFPTTWVRHLPAFPTGRKIQLPYPPVTEVVGIEYDAEAGESPRSLLDPSLYTLKVENGIPVVELQPTETWPTTASVSRAVSVVYKAGYAEYPALLKRYVTTLAVHFFEFPGPVMTETRQITNRAVEHGLNLLRASLIVPVSYDDWEG